MSKIHQTFKDNPLAWGFYFFPHHFRSESPPFHIQIIKAIMNNDKVVIAAPRGSAKTTLIDLLVSSHGICFKRFRHIILIQASLNKAAENLATLKYEFAENDLLRDTYNITFDRDNAEQTIFRHPDGFRTQFTCFGREQIGKVRGAKFGAYRPDLILVDDLEDDELVRTRDLREELHRKYEDSIEPAVDELENYKIIYIDTMKHYDSQLAKMLRPDMYKEYTKLKFAARYEYKGQKKSLWPEKWDVDWLNQLEKDSPIKFAKEYQNEPITGENQIFDPKNYRRWTVNCGEYVLYDRDGGIVSKGSLKDCRCAIGYDLAWEEKRKHDSTAIVPVLITPNSEYLVDTYVNKRGIKPDKLADIMFVMDDKYNGMTGRRVTHGFEKGKYEKVAKWFLGQEFKKRNKFLIVVDVPWVSDKIERISTILEPRYNNQAVFHRKDMGDLENQLTHFPSAVHDDLPDATHIAVRLLSEAPKKKNEESYSDDEKFKKQMTWLRNKSTTKRYPNNLSGIPSKRSIYIYK